MACPVYGCAFKARATLTRVIAQTLCVPEQQATLSPACCLTMMRRLAAGVPKSVQDAFRMTDTSHVIAISGQM